MKLNDDIVTIEASGKNRKKSNLSKQKQEENGVE